MNCPAQLTIVRHAESEYNKLVRKKQEMPEYQDFCEEFRREWGQMEINERTLKVLMGEFPSPSLRETAIKIVNELQTSYSDADTPLTEAGWHQAVLTGKNLRNFLETIPDVIYISPYLRVKQTLEGLQEGCPELKDVEVFENERLREQEMGLRTLYNDRWLYLVLNPKDGLLCEKEGAYSHRYPNGESQIDVKARVARHLEMVMAEHPGQHVMNITHHRVILALMGKLENWSREEFIEKDGEQRPENCGITTFKKGKNGLLTREHYNKNLWKPSEDNVIHLDERRHHGSPPHFPHQVVFAQKEDEVVAIGGHI